MEYSDMKIGSGGPSPLANNYSLVGDDSPLMDFVSSVTNSLKPLLSSPLFKSPLTLFALGLILRYVLGLWFGVDAALALTATLGLLTLGLVHVHGESEKARVLGEVRSAAADAARALADKARKDREAASAALRPRSSGAAGGARSMPTLPPAPAPVAPAGPVRHDDTIVMIKNGRVLEPTGGGRKPVASQLVSGIDKFGEALVPPRRLAHVTKLYDGKRKKKDKKGGDEDGDKDETRVWSG